jgi:hypothetical protein
MCHIKCCDARNFEDLMGANPFCQLLFNLPFNPSPCCWIEIKTWFANMAAITIPTPPIAFPMWELVVVAVMLMVSRNCPNNIPVLERFPSILL